jgi:hypothetical protein
MMTNGNVDKIVTDGACNGLQQQQTTTTTTDNDDNGNGQQQR